MKPFKLMLITLQKKRTKGWLKYLYDFECEPELKPADLKTMLTHHINHFLKP